MLLTLVCCWNKLIWKFASRIIRAERSFLISFIQCGLRWKMLKKLSQKLLPTKTKKFPEYEGPIQRRIALLENTRALAVELANDCTEILKTFNQDEGHLQNLSECLALNMKVLANAMKKQDPDVSCVNSFFTHCLSHFSMQPLWPQCTTYTVSLLIRSSLIALPLRWNRTSTAQVPSWFEGAGNSFVVYPSFIAR